MDFGTMGHEVLSIVLRNGERVLGISLFRKDKSVEYFLEKMPQCCYNLEKGRKIIHHFCLGIPRMEFERHVELLSMKNSTFKSLC